MSGIVRSPFSKLDPVTRKRLQRFRRLRRAWYSFVVLLLVYVVTLGAELLCNDQPLLVRCNGRLYMPFLRTIFAFLPPIPENDVVEGGRLTPANFKALRDHEVFRDSPENWMLFAPVPYGPHESLEPETIDLPARVLVGVAPAPKLGNASVNPDLTILDATNPEEFFDGKSKWDLRGASLPDFWVLPTAVTAALEQRFNNRESPELRTEVDSADGERRAVVVLRAYAPRRRPPRYLRITFQEETTLATEYRQWEFLERESEPVSGDWSHLPETARNGLREALTRVFDSRGEVAEPFGFEWEGRSYEADFRYRGVTFPSPPSPDHRLGTDAAGRDVFARILYGSRVSVTFGLVLAVSATVIGIAMGALQGYFAGKLDIAVQRVVEVWSAIPFLYVMILVGNALGRHLILLILCYAVFNWIGLSYYMRAEFLRLRKQAFVEAGRCLGLPTRTILFRHILPNALTPVITQFPFVLVGALGMLNALDFLGFGLDPLDYASLGELFNQARANPFAWWLILFPGLSLFAIMLLGVFVGEGVREAFDPRRYARIE